MALSKAVKVVGEHELRTTCAPEVADNLRYAIVNQQRLTDEQWYIDNRNLVQVRGDIFVARVFDNEDEFKRLDFTLAEVSSSADWMRQAALQNQKKRKVRHTWNEIDFRDL